MVGLYYAPDPLESLALREQGEEAVPAGTGQVHAAELGEGFAANYFPRILRSVGRTAAETGVYGADEYGRPIQGEPEPAIDPDVVNAEFGIPGHLKFDKPTPRSVAKDLHDHKLESLQRQEIISRREGGVLTGGAARFVTNIVAGTLDPINLAVGFIPVAGEARIAAMLEQAGSAVARAGIRAGIGGAQGAVGMLALQPLEFGLSRQEHEDYTMGDALRSIALGTVMGGGMHAGIGAGLDRYTGRYRNPVARGLDGVDPDVREGLLQGSLGQVIDGRPVDVKPALDLVPETRGTARFIEDPLVLHERGELSSARAAEIRDAVTAASPEEIARLQAAGVPVDPEMWKVVADNLAKAEASREGGLAVVTDQLQYLPATGELDTASAREAAAVIRRAVQLETERGGDPAAMLNQAIADAAVPAAVAEQARRLLAPAAAPTPAGAAPAAGLAGLPVPSMPAHRVATAAGRSVDVAPIVVEARNLIASNDPGYDPALQPRQRDRAASQQQVREIASALVPERLGVSAEADRGAPIVGDDGMVESGNGRVMAIRAAYAADGAPAAAYREWLGQQGVDLAGFDQPVLVRQRTTPMTSKERADFAVEANRAATLQLSAPERAMADARSLTPDMLDLLRNPDNLEAVANRDFVRAFIQSLPQAEQGAMATADGGLSAEGLARVRHAILARAYGGTANGAAILSRMVETTQDEIRSISNALTAAAPLWARLRSDIEAGRVVPEVDLTPELLEAARRTADLRNRGQTFADFLRQQDAFDVLPPRVEAFMSLFYDPKGTRAAGVQRITEGLRQYAIEANKVSAERGLDLGLPAITPDQIQQRITQRSTGGGDTGGLFGGDRPDLLAGGTGAGADGAALGAEVRRPGVGDVGAEPGAAGEPGAGQPPVGAAGERPAAAPGAAPGVAAPPSPAPELPARAPAAGEPGGPRPGDTLAEINKHADELERLQRPPQPGEPPRPESQAAADLVAEAESHASAVERAAYCITR